MIIVLDASAAVEVVLNRKQAENLSDLLSLADSVIVPSLFIAEVTNVFWKYYKHSDMPINECGQYLDSALKIPDEVIDINEMAHETLNAAALTGMTAYDMFYMVLARRDGAHLMTLDKKLKMIAKKQGINIY
jgi:predicted nucleic acid-binding protein